ncbi:hypothetical protein [Stieleria sp.]
MSRHPAISAGCVDEPLGGKPRRVFLVRRLDRVLRVTWCFG